MTGKFRNLLNQSLYFPSFYIIIILKGRNYMLKFAICDDNLNILDRLEKMLDNIFIKNNFEANVSYRCSDTTDMLDYVSNNKVDVIMLDINLKCNKTGLELAEAIRKINKDAYIIFTTAHLEYAMVAYKFKTFDYLAKPITYDRLEAVSYTHLRAHET